MTETFTLRFLENEYYDIQSDQEMVRLMAVSPVGTWQAVVPAAATEPLRVRREAFKALVLQAASMRQPPGDVILG